MDFELAASRLARDQRSSLARSRAARDARSAGAKARRDAARARAEAERRLKAKKLEGERSRRVADVAGRRARKVERTIGAADVGAGGSTVGVGGTAEPEGRDSPSPSPSGPFERSPLARGWTFPRATSVHGEGDKVALPPSILEAMTSGDGSLDPWGGGGGGRRPIAFRIGVLDPEYGGFPSSDKMRALVDEIRNEVIASEGEEKEHRALSFATEDSNGNHEDEEEDDDDDDENDETVMEAYLDELSRRYLSYTHGTVVEFTQEEGCVGLPESVARALLRARPDGKAVPTTRTVDPASGANAKGGGADDDDDAMAVDADARSDAGETGAGEEKTPGHPAYGLFPVPALSIELVPLRSLPPGKNCTFSPTREAVKNGFYAVKDVKAVLEQSLMRTRATLSEGDVVRTWRRGTAYDLVVAEVKPGRYGAVSCVDTDLNVDIGPAEGTEDGAGDGDSPVQSSSEGAMPKSKAPNGGRTLSEPASRARLDDPAPSSAGVASPHTADLPPEPPEDVKAGVCAVRIRGRSASGSAATGMRRFDVKTATLSDLFAFASVVCEGADPTRFRLVTRFPRRVFQLSGGDADPGATLEEAGVGEGQEMFMVEVA
ncbi:hypothetical protein ACHAWF_003957 [Thalassiosira exigua]